MGSVFLAIVLLVLLVCTIQVARCPDLVHAVFWLAATLLTTSVLMVSLGAPFLAGIQIILYTGGVITLMLFGVMLTHRESAIVIPNPVHRPAAAGVAATTLLVILLTAIWTTPELEPSQLTRVAPVTAEDIGRVFLTDQLLAFEVLSVLLLAAMIGAIVLSRRRDP